MKRIAGWIILASIALLEACAGHSTPAIPPLQQPQSVPQGQVTTMSVTPTPSPFPSTVTVGSGELFGYDNAWTPNDGDSNITGTGQFVGGQGQTVDNVPCKTTMPNTYHIHSFVGVIINGKQLAMPDGAGMKNPGPDQSLSGGIKYWTDTASCFYYIHMHDPSGVMHVESPSTASKSTALYTLGTFFDIWGMKLSTTQIGPHTGTVRVYVAQVPLNTNPVPRTAYALYTGNPRSIPLHSHTTTWLEIGPKYITPSQLPAIHYYEEY